MRFRLLSLMLVLLAVVATAGCAPRQANLTPLAASSGLTPTRLAIDGPYATATATSTGTTPPPLPSVTPTATFTPPATRTPPGAEPAGTPWHTAIPTMLPPLPDRDNTTVMLLIGTDSFQLDYIGRTDALVLVALHHEAKSASLLSIPRDLLVYIPTRGMDRINTAFTHGTQTGYPGGGAALLRDTIAYNFGIHAQWYARVDFTGFEGLINTLGGIEVAVDCLIQDWALRPEGNPANEDDWAMLTLPAGVHRLDGRTALWYVRSRRTSSDLDRGRRQQDVLRAVGTQIQNSHLLDALPATWELFTGFVDTNLTLDRAIGLAPLALQLNTSQIDRLIMRRDIHYTGWTTPDGQSVLLPVGDALSELVASFLAPPTENRLVLADASVHVINHSGQPGMARIAADRLAWEGITATSDDSGGGAERQTTVIIDFTGRTKASPLESLQNLLNIDDDHVILRPDRNRTVDFQVEIGRDFEPCLFGVLPPE